LSEQLNVDASSTDDTTFISADLMLLQEAAAALSSVASRAELRPSSAIAEQAILEAEQALAVLRRALGSHT